MKKVVVKLDLHDDKGKRKAMKSVSSLPRIDSISMDMKDKKLTVVGDIDPVEVVGKLKKSGWYPEIVSVGPAKEEKKEDKKDGGGKKDDEEKNKTLEKQVAELVRAYRAYNPYTTQVYHVVSAEENPNSCVIC